MKNQKETLSVVDFTKIFPHPSKEETNIPIFAGATFKMTNSHPNFLLGPSGSGKTTLLRILLGLEKLDAGEIFFNDLPLHRLKSKEKLRFLKTVGYLDQFPAKYLFLNLTILQNLEYSLILHQTLTKEERKKKILKIIEEFKLENLADKKSILLSGGELQRLSLACNMIYEPVLLLCDEPTAQLDKKSKNNVMNLIINTINMSSTLVLIATHDRTIIKNFPTFEIKNGRIEKCQ